MNRLTTRNRKIIYALVALLLFVPIYLMGAPANQEKGSGGQLAQMRYRYELGESSLGDVDPTSATMNLVLLGMRGVAASLLWQQAEHEKATKNFYQMEQTVESIILLQPHFKTVWEFQAWNLTYNVAPECDDVADRFHWVKRGIKFLMRGQTTNEKIPELKFETGRFTGQKIGLADERATFRKFFKVDPDTKTWKDGPDRDINPDQLDNYLVAKKWYSKANDTLEIPGVTQHKMDLALFVAYPHRSQIDYATGLQKDGVKTENLAKIQPEAIKEWKQDTINAWKTAHLEWTTEYGLREILTADGQGGVIVLAPDQEKLQELADREGVSLDQKRLWHEHYRRTTSYPFWEQHCGIEQREITLDARYNLAEGKRLYGDVSDFEGARKHLELGMAQLQEVISLYNRDSGTNAIISDESGLVEEGIKSLLIWKRILQLQELREPDDYPLKALWTHPDLEYMRQDLAQQFLLWKG